MAIICTGDWGINVGGPTLAAGHVVLLAHPEPDEYAYTPQTHLIIPLPTGVPQAAVLPDLYDYYPGIVKYFDQELVDRPDIPLYYWDTIPDWDTSPYTWDELIGPEPILKATTRVMQLELERSAKEIRDLALLYDVDRCDRLYLPYLSEMLGAPLPSTTEEGQRNFVKRIVDTYRSKGTPLSFMKLFHSLGFNATIVEQYQRKSDAEFVTGPQKALVATTLVQREPVGTTTALAGPYTIQLLNTPIVRGSIRVSVYDQSLNTPTVLIDNGGGGWSNNIVGSINYMTGAATFTLAAPPTLVGSPIRADYNFQTDPFPDPFKKRWLGRFRSSFIAATLTPLDPSVVMSPEMNQRLLLYLTLLKPAHIVIQALSIVLEFADTEYVTDDLNPLALLHIESLFGTLYRGYGWDSEDNGSLSTDPALVGLKARDGGEFIRTYVQASDEPPYVYPFFRDGKFYQPNSADDWEAMWYSPLTTFDSTVTADIPVPTTTNFSIVKGAGTTLGVNDKVCFTSGILEGEFSIITIFVDMGAYYDVTVAPALPVAPAVSDTVTIVDDAGVNRNGLVNRPQDPMSIYFIEVPYIGAPPQAAFAGAFLGKIPVEPSSVTLTFTIGATTYTETDDGIGGFTNVSGQIAAASIVYVTGAVDVTFVNPPDAGTDISYTYLSTTSGNLGVM